MEFGRDGKLCSCKIEFQSVNKKPVMDQVEESGCAYYSSGSGIRWGKTGGVIAIEQQRWGKIVSEKETVIYTQDEKNTFDNWSLWYTSSDG